MTCWHAAPPPDNTTPHRTTTHRTAAAADALQKWSAYYSAVDGEGHPVRPPWESGRPASYVMALVEQGERARMDSSLPRSECQPTSQREGIGPFNQMTPSHHHYHQLIIYKGIYVPRRAPWSWARAWA